MEQSYLIIRIWALLAMLGCSMMGSAQDTLVLAGGTTKLAHVIKVTEFDLLYKAWDSINGPDYRMDLNQLSAIRYQGGNITQLGIADSLRVAPKSPAGAQRNSDSIAPPDKSLASVKAPDTIILLNGEAIAVKIVSENDREITYKKWNNPDGPVYHISVAHLTQVKRMQGKASRANGLDTLVLRTGRELTCQIEAVSDCSVQYDALRLRPGQSFANMPLAYVTMIKYATSGRYLVINHHPMQDPHAVMRNCQFTFQKQAPVAPFSEAKYYSYLRASRACTITGLVMIGVGVTTTFAGFGVMASQLSVQWQWRWCRPWFIDWRRMFCYAGHNSNALCDYPEKKGLAV